MATLGISPFAVRHNQPPIGGGGGGSGGGGSGGSGTGGGGGGTFSPLTMFECTISSATMLIDNMAVRDLLVAFKIVAQLHGHLLEVLDPTVQRLANVADEHSMCPPPVTQPMMPGSSTTLAPSVTLCASSGKKLLDQSVSSAAVNLNASSSSVPIKPEIIDSDDDCVLMEADLVFDQHQSPHQLFPHQQQQQHQQAGRSSDSTASGDLSNEWKGILRKAYRVLKDETGTNVFDFSLPYSARINVQAANRVIDKALELSSHKPANVDAWRILAVKYFRYYYAKNLKYPFRSVVKNVDTQRFIRRLMKLNRRQKSYELMKDELDPTSRVKYESVLTRDYTSSDEEGGTDLDSEMKVRSLPWESDELRSVKSKLDEVFLTKLADEKQRSELARLQRDPTVLSNRPPPADSLGWAKKPDWQSLPGMSGGGGGSGGSGFGDEGDGL